MEINSENVKEFNSSIRKTPTLVWYYATWCIHCERFMKTWKRFVKICNNKYPKLTVVKIESEMISKLNFEPNINGYPTLKFYNKDLNSTDNDFYGERTTKSLLNFVKDSCIKHKLNLSHQKNSKKAVKSILAERKKSTKRKKSNKKK